MRAGTLRTLLTVQENQATSPAKDTLGHKTLNWVTVKQLRGEVVTLTGEQLLRATQIAGELTHQVTVRYWSELTRKHRFLFRGNPLDINTISDTNQKHKELVCLCKEAKK